MKRTPWTLALVYLCGAAALLLFAGMLIRMSETTTAIRQTQTVSKSSVDTIRDCTEVGGKCYEKSQRRTAKVVEDIVKGQVYAAVCADQPGTQTDREVYACVLRKLEADKKAAEQ